MTSSAFVVFAVPGGYAGLAWRADQKKISGSLLPVRAKREAERRMRELGAVRAQEVPSWIEALQVRIRNYFEQVEARTDLAKDPSAHASCTVVDTFNDVEIATDSLPKFHRLVYTRLRAVVAGRTVSYGELAKLSGSPNSARAVGQAMARNPFPLIVPCHRVLASNGKLQGFSAERGTDLKAEMLDLELQ